VRRSTHEALDGHRIVARCVHRVLTDRHLPVPEGVVDHFRHATRDHVRTASRSQAAEAGKAVRHGNDHPSLRRHDDSTRTGNDRDHRSPPVTSADDRPAGIIHDNRAATPTHDGNAGELYSSFRQRDLLRAREYCRDSDHGATGRAGDGESITCEDNDGVAVGAVVTFRRPAPDNASTTPSGVDEMKQWAVEKPHSGGLASLWVLR
jgi:hypothetical protein